MPFPIDPHATRRSPHGAKFAGLLPALFPALLIPVAALLFLPAAIPLFAADAAPGGPGTLTAPVGAKISIGMKDAPLSQVLAELGRQSELTLALPANAFPAGGEPKVSLDGKDLPFWQAMRDVCAQANLNVATTPVTAGKLTLQKGPQFGAQPYAMNSGFLLTILGGSRDQTLDLINPANSTRRIALSLRFYCPPGVKILRVRDATADRALDEKGKPLNISNRTTGVNGQVDESLQRNMSINLDIPPELGARLGELQTNVGLLLRSKSQTVTIDKPLGAKGQSYAVGEIDESLNFVSLQKSGANYELILDTVYPGPGIAGKALAGFAHPILNLALLRDAVKLTDANGTAYRITGTTSSTARDKGQFKFTFAPPAAPARGQPAQVVGEPAVLTMDLPVEMQATQLSFTFKDLPLP